MYNVQILILAAKIATCFVVYTGIRLSNTAGQIKTTSMLYVQ